MTQAWPASLKLSTSSQEPGMEQLPPKRPSPAACPVWGEAPTPSPSPLF